MSRLKLPEWSEVHCGAGTESLLRSMGNRTTYSLLETIFGLIEWPLRSASFPKQEARVDKLNIHEDSSCAASFTVDAHLPVRPP
jgi:hypothetical protein